MRRIFDILRRGTPQEESHVNDASRRRFIQLSTVLAVAPWLPNLENITSLAQTALRARGERLATQEEIIAAIWARLEKVFAGKQMGIVFAAYDQNHQPIFNIEINADRIYPVASSFKAAAAFYYFMNTPEEQWQNGPGTHVYRMAVYSNNGETGEVLGAVARTLGKTNPIVAFNDFITDSAYLGLSYGLNRWSFKEFTTPTDGYSDERFANSAYPASQRFGTAINYTTAHDLARVFTFLTTAENDPRWLTDSHFKQAVLATRQVLSIPATDVNFSSALERAIPYIRHYSKEGYLQPEDIGTNTVNDAGVWLPQGGRQYVISFMSTSVWESVVNDALVEVAGCMRDFENADGADPYNRINTEPSAEIMDTGYQYGWVRINNVPLYSVPSEKAQQTNPVRATSVFGTTYLMYGAMVRFMPVDTVWGKIIPDDGNDQAFSQDTYIKLADLQIVNRNEISRRIDYVSTDRPLGKFMVLNVYRRELTLFEGATPIFKTPVVLNTDATPRGVYPIGEQYLSQDMPNYPGVPFSSVLMEAGAVQHGFAVHGSPWHLWAQTVKQADVPKRFSHGCINVPNWEITIPYLGGNMRPDEFIFRWLGGLKNPAQNTREFADPSIRIISVNNYSELLAQNLPAALAKTSTKWPDVIAAIANKPLDVPAEY